MKLLYIGAGFVGTCSAAVAASSGHDVLVYDIDDKKIHMLSSGDRDQIEACLYEEGLSDLLIRNKERIEFTQDYDKVTEFLNTCDVIFMCLPTPEIGETGESNLTYYDTAAKQLATHLSQRNNGAQEKYIVIVNKSTVPIDMVDKTIDLMTQAGVKQVGVVSNPEFLVEGKAIQGSIKPDRVVVGAWNDTDFAIMRKVYERFYDSPQTKYIEVNPREAAAAKLLANYMLFNKLAVCFDVVGRVCETFENVDFEHVRSAIVSDPRIGSWGLYNSLFAGGSCFTKDTRSLAHQLHTRGVETVLLDEVGRANIRQLQHFLNRATAEAGVDWQGKNVAVLGTSFKRDTNDIRNSPSIEVVKFLQSHGVSTIHIYDPSGSRFFATVFPESDVIHYCNHEFDAVQQCDILIIATDWPQFRGVGDMLLGSDTRPLIMDGRRMLQHRYTDLAEAGCDIIAVGSPFIQGNKS